MTGKAPLTPEQRAAAAEKKTSPKKRRSEPKVSSVPIHKWTHDGTKVLILKCVDANGKSHGGFQWPKSGRVEAKDWNPSPVCGGGLHGWPWGLAIGDGKDPIYANPWLVFAADPADVIDLGGKVKARAGEVIYYGDWAGALAIVARGLSAWASQPTTKKSSNSGFSGAASNSGVSGAASNSGDWGAASNSGDWGAALTVGEESTIELSRTCVGCAIAQTINWRVHVGAVLLVGWRDGDKLKHVLFDSATMKLDENSLLTIVNGKIQK